MEETAIHLLVEAIKHGFDVRFSLIMMFFGIPLHLTWPLTVVASSKAS